MCIKKSELGGDDEERIAESSPPAGFALRQMHLFEQPVRYAPKDGEIGRATRESMPPADIHSLCKIERLMSKPPHPG